MRLVGFRVQMFRCVLDSGWIDVSPLTVLVGKNESGKTAMLKALHKLNPAVPEPYSIDREWPRRYRKDRDEGQVVCSARFELSPEEVQELKSFSGQEVIPSIVEVRRDYSGQLEILFPPELFPDRLQLSDIDPLLSLLPDIPDVAGSAFSETAQECLNETRRLIMEGRFTNLAAVRGDHIQALLGKVTFVTLPIVTAGPSVVTVAGATGSQAADSGASKGKGRSKDVTLQPASEADAQAAASADAEAGEAPYVAQQPRFPHEQEFIEAYQVALEQITEKITATPSMLEKAREYILKHMPAFVYMSDYQTFTGSAQLDQVKQRKDRGELSQEDRTLLTIMDLAGLDLDDEVRKGDLGEREQRQFDLDDASVVLTQYLSEHKQRRYQVQLRADGQKFYTFVKDEYDPSLILLEERSRGFQWFFSFDLMFMHASKGTFQNCVVLLDEPGLHLHPDAQKDLLKRLREYSGDNTIVYTSHLPFMVDLERPDRIRVLSESPNGTIVTDDLMKSQAEAKFVLQSALAVASSPSYLVTQRNLVVEGVDDYWILTELSRLMQRSGEIGLPGDLFVVPSGGAAEAAYVATFMVDHDLDVVVMFDSDDGGDGFKKVLAKKWLSRYPSKHAEVLSLADCMGYGETGFSIEDIFREEFYVRKVREVYIKQLNAAGCEELSLPAGGQLAVRVERALAQYGIKFDKVAVAKALRASLSKMETIEDLSQETRLAARRIFSAINEALPQE
ncbi:MAG: AAA family ATPase [Firmicutes bacterium]|nr:AAA family ATPase [Bacillota bacterium]